MLDQATRKFDKRIHAGFKYIYSNRYRRPQHRVAPLNPLQDNHLGAALLERRILHHFQLEFIQYRRFGVS